MNKKINLIIGSGVLGAYLSADLIKKKELIILNKIDLVEEKLVKEITDDFSKKINGEILLLSTVEKKSISKIKAKLISYAS